MDCKDLWESFFLDINPLQIYTVMIY